MCYVIRFGSFITCKRKTDAYAYTKTVRACMRMINTKIWLVYLWRGEVNGVKVYTGEVSIISVLCSLKYQM